MSIDPLNPRIGVPDGHAVVRGRSSFVHNEDGLVCTIEFPLRTG